MSGQVGVVRVQVDDEGHAVGVDLSLVRTWSGPRLELVSADSLPPDVRTALLEWLMPEGYTLTDDTGYPVLSDRGGKVSA